MRIATGAHVFGCSLMERMASVAGQQALDLPEVTASSNGAVYAEVNHNRWIVECPDCHSAEYLWPDEPIFMCTNCFNEAVGGRWRIVRIPSCWEEIERVLCARPFPRTRNWRHDETLAQLRAENVAHGHPEEVT